MYHRVHQSKYRQEVLSLVWDFSDQVAPGDSIAAAELTILVSSGDDPDPSDVIKGVPSWDNLIVTQQIRRGIPGTIYTMVLVVETVGGDFFEGVAYLAILPLGPLTVTIWETTQLYPLESMDNLQGTISPRSGLLKQGLYPIPPEPLQGYSILREGELIGQNFVRYNIPHEDIQGYTVLVEGELVEQIYVHYDIPHEDIQGLTYLVSGQLVLQVIRYTIPHEDMQGFSILTSGHLA